MAVVDLGGRGALRAMNRQRLELIAPEPASDRPRGERAASVFRRLTAPLDLIISVDADCVDSERSPTFA